MKITFVLPNIDLSGGVRVVATYANLLKQRGHEVFVVCTPERQPTPRQQLKSLLKGQGWISVMQKPSHFDGLDIQPKIIERWRPITDADVPDADVVVATWWETAEWVANLSTSKGAKAYFIQHHEVFDYLPKERVAATWSLPLHKTTISQWLVDLARNQYGDHNVSLVPNSVDTTQFYAPTRDKQSVPTVGILYSTNYWKGCDVSLKAFSLATQKIPGLRLVAFGTSTPSTDLPLPRSTEYIQKPAQNQIKDIYASCDVWLCGSWSEGFHLPPLEAMACRCPVVSTQVGGPMDIIKNGVNGYLVPVGDAAGLAEKLVNVLTLPEREWRIMSDAAYTTAIKYTWDDAAEIFERALHIAVAREQSGEFVDLYNPRDVYTIPNLANYS